MFQSVSCNEYGTSTKDLDEELFGYLRLFRNILSIWILFRHMIYGQSQFWI